MKNHALRFVTGGRQPVTNRAVYFFISLNFAGGTKTCNQFLDLLRGGQNFFSILWGQKLG